MGLNLKTDPPTVHDIGDLLRAGDDSVHNQVCVRIDGTVFLAQNLSNRDDSDVLFRFESYAAGNNYVGSDITDTMCHVRGTHRTLLANWPIPKCSYIDWYDD
jgi:hypothetical protein